MKETAISSSKDLWHYCTEDHVRTMLLSFRLLGDNDWPEEKILACLYSLSNHTQDHYKRIQIQKKSGGTPCAGRAFSGGLCHCIPEKQG